MSKGKFVAKIILALSIGVHLAHPQASIASSDTKELRDQNSKLFNHSGSTHTIDDYVDLANAKTDDDPGREIVISDIPPNHGWTENPSDTSTESYLLTAAANSDLVVIIEPFERQSAQTEDHRFVFSDYTASVDRVIWSRNLTVLPGQNVVIARAGGILTYRGRTVVGSVKGFALFRLHEPYLIFLRLLPNGTFGVIGSAAYNLRDQEVDTGSFLETKDSKEPSKRLVPKAQFLAEVDRAVERLASQD